jgi:hypothetical protein
MLGYIKLAVAAVVLAGGAGAFIYVKTLQSDLAVSKANNAKLEQSVADQKAVIVQQQEDIASVLKANKDIQQKANQLEKGLADLNEKFVKVNASGEKRDIGQLAQSKPKAMNRVFNTATENALRCTEIAMGAPLTDKERNATKKSEINPECPTLANPNYVSTGD